MISDIVVSEPAAEAPTSSVAWGAIIAGAVAAAATTLILGFVGTGLGLAMASPWAGVGHAAATFAVSTAIWLVVTQWVASGVGGYITGRLRTRWSLGDDEVFFRDTAHGFLAWALSTLVAATLLASAASAVIGGAASTAASVASGAASGAVQAAGDNASALSGQADYMVDRLLRPSAVPPQAGAASAEESRAEVSRIVLRGIAGDISQPDRDYLAQVIAARAGISQDDAKKRVDDTLAQIEQAKQTAKEAADKARKASATTAMLTALALLIGAFIASAAAVLGGRLRDE